jgi:hypothetical protein
MILDLEVTHSLGGRGPASEGEVKKIKIQGRINYFDDSF